ncbi:MAG: protein kinase domain-containing protein, partial [Actinomycetota bacterium]
MATEEIPMEGRKLAGRYALQEEVASGGMGTLWRGHDEVLGRTVAVKVLHERLARDPDLLDRFRLEAVAAARLSHPNVVRVFDTGTFDGVCFIVMELVDGTTLEDVLRERRTLEPAEASRIVRGVLLGLAHAHREGVIHRDVKPANVLIDRSGLVKVTDFGIAKAAFSEEDLTTTGSLLGTARYLAPEQVTSSKVDGRTDVYAAGIVLYEALTGKSPFEAETHIATATMRLTKDPVPPGSMRPRIGRPLDAVVMRALAREPADRFQSAEEMAAALDRAAPSDRAPHQAAPPPDRAPARSGGVFRSWMMVPLVLLIVAGLVVGAYILLEGLPGANGNGPGAEPDRSGEPVELVDASSFDPEGSGTPGEHDEDLGFAIDPDRESFWQTEGYNSADMDKEGVGLVVELPD